MTASSTPRKSTARKAPAKRTAEQKTADNVAQFAEYRERAAKTNYVSTDRTTEPYIVRGFDPVIEIHRPDLKKQLLLDRLLRAGRTIDAIELLCGQHYSKIVDTFALFPDGDALLYGMFDEMVEHFNGPGATSVPGGYPAS